MSAVSAWEVATKSALGKIRATRSIEMVMQDNGFIELPILMRHGEAVRALPDVHLDPFDRLLVEQAQVEELVVVTRNQALTGYGLEAIGA